MAGSVAIDTGGAGYKGTISTIKGSFVNEVR
jgi:hypothetical protein